MSPVYSRTHVLSIILQKWWGSNQILENNRMKNEVCRIGRPRFYLEKSACDGGISLFFFITFIGDNTLLIGAEVLVVTVL